MDKMKTEEIVTWKDALVQLPDSHFFNMIGLYLGKIKTPFNKQNLIEKLSSFLHRDAVQDILVKGLDENDVRVLTAIHVIDGISKAELARFFSPQFSHFDIYERLSNLEERLLIYKAHIEDLKTSYKITPFLINKLRPFLSKNIFLLPEKKDTAAAKEFALTAVALIGIYSFCFHNEDILKNDGTLKKKYTEILQRITPQLFQNEKTAAFVFTACENLGLLLRTENGYAVQKQKWRSFMELEDREMYAYFAAASCFKMRKENMPQIAQVFFNFIDSLEENAYYAQTDLEQYLFLLYSKAFYGHHLRSEILEKSVPFNSDAGIINAAVRCGILCRDDSFIYLNPLVKNAADKTARQKPLLINASFEVTVFPERGIKNILDAAEAMHPVLIQTTGKFEITKETCFKVFQYGASAEALCEILAENTEHKLPQNVAVSIREWYKNCTALSVHNGFVISVSEEKRIFFEKDTPLKKLVRKKLAAGIYILNIDDLHELKAAVYASGLEFIFYNTKNAGYSAKNSFINLHSDYKKAGLEFALKEEWRRAQEKRTLQYKKIIDNLNLKVRKQSFSSEEKEILRTMILNKTIIEETQLHNGGINLKTKEAAGIDFSGKLKIAELAAETDKNLELYVNTETGLKKISGRPVEIIKKEKNAELILIAEPKKEKFTISLAHIFKIKLV